MAYVLTVLDFQIIFRTDRVRFGSTVLPDSENMCIAVKVLSLSCVTSVHVSQDTILLLPVTFDRFADGITETVDNRNIAVTRGIVQLVCFEPATHMGNLTPGYEYA